MDNLRRGFLTKDEVKSLGAMELTNQTTDDIQALWLPVRGMYDLIGTSSILFKYRTKNHSDLKVSAIPANAAYYRSYLGYDYQKYPVELQYDSLRFKWSYQEPNRYPSAVGCTVNFNSLAGYMSDGRSSYSSAIRFVDMAGEDVDWYVRIDITKFSFSLVSSTNGSSYDYKSVGDFLIQYLSGDVPADTIFYEPYED